jgi:hypothetical protein
MRQEQANKANALLAEIEKVKQQLKELNDEWDMQKEFEVTKLAALQTELEDL